MRGYWMRPKLTRVAKKHGGGGDLLLGPLQFNWYNDCFKVHVTWPTQRTYHLGRKARLADH